MRIHVNLQEAAYAENWGPMQKRLGDSLTEYIRHFLMRDGKIVRQNDVYFTLKESIEDRNHDEILAYLQEVALFSRYYTKLLFPKEENNPLLSERMARLNRYEATTAYPFLLNVYNDYEIGKLSACEFVTILDIIETFLIRRFTCGVATSGLTKIFPFLYAQSQRGSSLVDGIRQTLRDKSFPRDSQFKEQFISAKIYGGDRSPKAMLILERLERSFEHKESINFDKLTIEHIMPRTPTDWWRQQLGEDWEAIHEEWLDTVGNLTLTAYNSELSNSNFPTKKQLLQKSHIELNKYFAEVETWDEQAISRRGEVLAERALSIWPDFTQRNDGTNAEISEEENVQEELRLLIARVLDHFGGEKERLGKGHRFIAKVADGKIINIKYSKRHGEYYWYGLHASLWEEMQKANATHIVFILLDNGFVTVPLEVMKEYIAEASYSPKTDGTVRHYHVMISPEPNPELFYHGKPDRIPLKGCYTKFDI